MSETKGDNWNPDGLHSQRPPSAASGEPEAMILEWVSTLQWLIDQVSELGHHAKWLTPRLREMMSHFNDTVPADPVEGEPVAIRQWRRVGALVEPGYAWSDWTGSNVGWESMVRNTRHETRALFTHPAEPEQEPTDRYIIRWKDGSTSYGLPKFSELSSDFDQIEAQYPMRAEPEGAREACPMWFPEDQIALIRGVAESDDYDGDHRFCRIADMMAYHNSLASQAPAGTPND